MLIALQQQQLKLAPDLNWETLWPSLPAELQAQAQRALTISQFALDTFCRDGSWFYQQLRSAAINTPVTKALLSTWLDALSADAQDEEQFASALRILRRRAQAQIIWQDLNRLTSTLQTTRAVSDLADLCVLRASFFLHSQLEPRFGTPMGAESLQAQTLYVLGMGKLGAYELNLSSDIDLIFAYPESGDTTGPKVISNQEYFVKLGQKLIALLDKPTSDGFVFRTDMRLRPYGQSGPLVMNFASLEDYYQSQGRDWERFAMIKARVLNGETTPEARALLAMLRAFSYRAYIDYSAFASLRSMKAMISAEIRRRNLGDNIKLGEGGIREIEFIVQAFQLIRGGQDKSLQKRELVKVLDILAAEGYLPEPVCSELKQAYFFLRDTEHVLQALNDEQTQLLPTDTDSQEKVALAMNCPSWPKFLAQLNAERERVAFHFAQIVADDEEHNHSQEAWQELWLGEMTAAEVAEFEVTHPCCDSAAIAALLEQLRQSRTVLKMQPVGRERLDELMPQLLAKLWELPNPSQTLERIIPLLDAVARRTTYIVLLNENPHALAQLLLLCSASSWLADYIAKTPLLLDELLDTQSLYRLPSKAELLSELQQRLLRIDEQDLEHQMEVLRQFARAHRLRTAACEVMQKLPLMKISDYLTWTAEAIVEMVMQLAWQHSVSKYGYPTNAAQEPVHSPELVVVAYGKLGGLELNYSSDLDLVLLHNSYAQGYSTGERSQDNGTFYARMGQRMIHILTTQTQFGDLYEIDMRLRPSGNSGLMVSSLKAFAEYQATGAWTWEQQALVRARVISGDANAAQEFQRIRATSLSRTRDGDKLKDEVRSMRQKMIDSLGCEKSTQRFHLKQDSGGIVDIEFLVQYLVLTYAHQYPSLLEVTDNMRLLDAFEAVGLMHSQDRQTLQETYLSYRAETHKRALQMQNLELDSATVEHLGFQQKRDNVTRLWNTWLGH
ncbi:MAG: hypothetical protein RL217_397 [Pseudomonadota bacterium]|jgi:glutamate-ammonia-ligase adenylyltransferase